MVEHNNNLFAATSCGLFVRRAGNINWDRLDFDHTEKLHLFGDTLAVSFHHGLKFRNLAMANFDTIKRAKGRFINSPPIALKDSLMISASSPGVGITYDLGDSVRHYYDGMPVQVNIRSNGDTSRYFKVHDVMFFNNEIYSAAKGGVYKSDLALSGWSRVNQDSVGYFFSFSEYNGTFYAMDNDSLYRSDDTAKTWQRLAALENGQYRAKLAFYNGDVFLTTDSVGIVSSSDSGNTWQAFNTGLHGNVNHIDTAGGNFYAFTTEGPQVWLGSTWHTESTKGMFCNSVESMVSNSNGLFASEFSGVYKYDGNNSWMDVSPSDTIDWFFGPVATMGPAIVVSAHSTGDGFTFDSTAVFVSPDGGTTWTGYDWPFHPTFLNFHFEQNILYAYNGGIHTSADGGKTWTAGSANPGLWLGNGEDNGLTLYDGKFYFPSSNNGQLVTYNIASDQWSTEIVSTGSRYEFEEIFKRDTVLFAHNWSQTFYKSPNSNWQILSNSPKYIVDAHNSAASLYSFSAEGMILRSQDFGQSWEAVTDTLPRAVYGHEMTIYRDTFFISAQWQAVFKHAVPEEGVSLEEVLNHQLVLYPNPAGNYVFINTGLPGKFSLSLTDIQGRVVLEKEIENSEKLNLPELKEGVYIISLNNGDVKMVGRLLIK